MKVGVSGFFTATCLAVHLFCVLVVLLWKAGTAKKADEDNKLSEVVDEKIVMEVFSDSVQGQRHHCARCFRPASKRCSRCKAVRYCSGRCQINHWRQEHKDNCKQSYTLSSLSSENSTKAGSLGSACMEDNFKHTKREVRDKELNDNSEGLSTNMIHAAPKEMRRSESIYENDHFSNVIGSKTSSSESAVRDINFSVSNSVPVSKIDNFPADKATCHVSTSGRATSCGVDSNSYSTANTLGCSQSVLDVPHTKPSRRTMSYSVDSHSFSDCIDSLKNETDLPDINRSAMNDSSSLSQRSKSYMPSNAWNAFSNQTYNVYSHNSTPSPLDESLKTRDENVADKSNALCGDKHTNPSEACLTNFAEDLFSSKISHMKVDDSCRKFSSSSEECSSSDGNTSEPEETRPDILSNSLSLPEQCISKGSLSSGTIKRSIGSAFQYFSWPKGRTSSQNSANNSCNSTDPLWKINVSPPSFVTLQQGGSGFKRSVKKVLLRAKFSKLSKCTVSNNTTSKPMQTLFPYEDFVRLFNWKALELYPCGLVNCGNSCYANVILQCLTHTRPLAAYLLHGYHSEKCKTINWCFMCELERLILSVKQGDRPLSPSNILSIIQTMRSHLGYGKQEDAHELLRLSIDCMQSICLEEAGGERLLDQASQMTTLIQQIFGGCLQSKVECLKCHYQSTRHENIMDLTVEIHGDIESLEHALAQFTAPELLDGDNKYKCGRCKTYVKAKKQLKIHEAPNILTIALKRFKSGKFGKLNKYICFSEILDLSPYMSGCGDEPPLYRLYAAVVHLDMLNSSFFGHYICYVKSLQGTWFRIDDTEVQPVHIDSVMSEGVYMLFYSRSSPRPPYVLNSGVQCSKGTHAYHNSCNIRQSVVPEEHNNIFVFNDNVTSLNSIDPVSNHIPSEGTYNSSYYAEDPHVHEVFSYEAYDDFSFQSLSSASVDCHGNPSDKECSNFTFSSSDTASWSTDSFRDSTSTGEM